MEVSNSTSRSQNDDHELSPITAEDYLELGKKALDLATSSWTVGGDAGLSQFQMGLELARCDPPPPPSSSCPFELESQELLCTDLYFYEGRALQKLKRWTESLSSFRRSLYLLESTVGRYHDSTAGVYLSMAVSYEGIGGDTARIFASAKYEVAARIERMVDGKTGRWGAQAAVKRTEATASFLSEVRGDVYADLQDLDRAREFYREAIIEERSEFGMTRNSNLVLLHRKMAMPSEHVFRCSSCQEVCQGDALYFDGDFQGAIEAYLAAATCRHEVVVATRIESDSPWWLWSFLILPVVLFVYFKKNDRTIKKTCPKAKSVKLGKTCVSRITDKISTFQGKSNKMTPRCGLGLRAMDNTLGFPLADPGSVLQHVQAQAQPDPDEIATSKSKDECATDDFVKDVQQGGDVVIDNHHHEGDSIICAEEDSDDDDIEEKVGKTIGDQDLMGSACGSLGAILARDSTGLDWSFQPNDSMSATSSEQDPAEILTNSRDDGLLDQVLPPTTPPPALQALFGRI